MKKIKIQNYKENFWKERCEKFFKVSKFDFRFKYVKKSGKKGIKKLRILLTFLFLIVDSQNQENDLNLPMPKLEEIAKFCKTHLSWVKKVKAQYFGTKSKISSDEFILMKKYHQKINDYNKIFGYKELALYEKEPWFYELNFKKRNSIFQTKTKVFVNWITTKKGKKHSYLKYSKKSFLKKDKKLKVGKVFIRSMWTKDKKWFEFPWLWKIIDFLRKNIEFYKKTKSEQLGIVKNWF